MDLVTCLKQHKFGVPRVCETLFKTVAPKGLFGVGWHSMAVPLSQHHARDDVQSPLSVRTPHSCSAHLLSSPPWLLWMLSVQTPVGKI